MAKKIVIELWVEPLTKSGNYFNFLDNVDEFIAGITKNGLSGIGEESYDLDIVDADARRG